MAEGFIKTVTRPLTKETKANLRDKIKTPANCKEFVTPKVNQDIWRMLPQQAKINDLKSQQLQQLVSLSLSQFAFIGNEIAKNKDKIPKEVTSLVLQTAIDGSNLLGDQFQSISYSRRLDMKRFLNPEYSGICNAKVRIYYLYNTNQNNLIIIVKIFKIRFHLVSGFLELNWLKI